MWGTCFFTVPIFRRMIFPISRPIPLPQPNCQQPLSTTQPRHLICFLPPAMLYEVLAPGYHSPLTKIQIAELFRAGRLRREYPCKPISQKEWRTIDELFPLLKYRSANLGGEDRPQPDASST